MLAPYSAPLPEIACASLRRGRVPATERRRAPRWPAGTSSEAAGGCP